MKAKRNALKKITGVSVAAAVLPSSWAKPIVSAVILPAHAETTTTTTVAPTPSVAPTISGVACATGQSGPHAGSSITIEVTISDLDTPIENITWTLSLNGSSLATGTGQFAPYSYTITEVVGTTLTFELEARDDAGNSVNSELCQITVSLPPA